jgi:hypothetical protein
MDSASIVLPGARALVTQILEEGWAQARRWLTGWLSRPGGPGQAALERRLDAANAEAGGLSVPETGVPEVDARRMVLEAYWTGYLAALAGEHPDLAEALTGLPGLRSAPPATTSNSVTGTVGNVLQANHIEGSVHFT